MTLDKQIFDKIYKPVANSGEIYYSETINRVVAEIKQVYDKRVCANCKHYDATCGYCDLHITSEINAGDIQSCLEFDEIPAK